MSGPIFGCARCGKRVDLRYQGREFSGVVLCDQCVGPYLRFRDEDLWPDKNVSWILSSVEEIESLTNELDRIIDTAVDEKPIQKFFESNPSMLVQLFRYGQGRWVFSQPRFGSEYRPDFMLCGLNSAGPHWHLIELENPNYPVLRKDGQQRSEFTHAMKQISDWRRWLRNNIAYAQSEDGLGYVGLDENFQSTIVMGRRKDITDKLRPYYRDVSSDTVEVMSYDRLYDRVVEAAYGNRAFIDRLVRGSYTSQATT